jgi:lactate dehydrogenase-like 2-hydroxyacid dehydrogenase
MRPIEPNAEVVVTVGLPTEVIESISKQYKLRELRLRDVGAKEFLSRLGSPFALIVAPGDCIDAQLIKSLPCSVRLIATYSAGMDHIDLVAAKEAGIRVASTPDFVTAATADLAMALILWVLRGATSAQANLINSKWTGWEPNQIYGRDLAGATLLIVGPGRIGTAVARRGKAFGMRITYWGRRLSSELDRIGAQFEPNFALAISSADIVSLHLPSNHETRGYLSRERISLMKDGAVLINTARGDLVDEAALIESLVSGKLHGAGLDVFMNEPHINPNLIQIPNVVVLPHIGSATPATRKAMGLSVLEALDSS